MLIYESTQIESDPIKKIEFWRQNERTKSIQHLDQNHLCMGNAIPGRPRIKTRSEVIGQRERSDRKSRFRKNRSDFMPSTSIRVDVESFLRMT